MFLRGSDAVLWMGCSRLRGGMEDITGKCNQCWAKAKVKWGNGHVRENYRTEFFPGSQLVAIYRERKGLCGYWAKGKLSSSLCASVDQVIRETFTEVMHEAASRDWRVVGCVSNRCAAVEGKRHGGVWLIPWNGKGWGEEASAFVEITGQNFLLLTGCCDALKK